MTSFAILKLVAKADPDLVVVRLRAGQIAELAKLRELERTRLATAVSEVVRSCLMAAAHEAKVEFNLLHNEVFDRTNQIEPGPYLQIVVSVRQNTSLSYDQRTRLKIVRNLVTHLTTGADVNGISMVILKSLPAGAEVSAGVVERWIHTLKEQSPFTVVEDLEQQNKELIDTLEEVERYRNELEEKSDQLRLANKYKGEFLANMSHEIRTPMNAVIGISNILDRTELTAEQRKYLRLIREAGASLLDIINDILDFSKIEAGKLSIEYIRFDLKDLLEACADLLSNNAHAKGLLLTADIDTDLPAHVIGDRTRIRQILMNLLSNAIKFTEKGAVTIRVRVLASTVENAQVRFEVKDTGIGLSEEQRVKLFQPFMQADGSTTRKYGGTGLGLSICRQLVELMNGNIGVDSTEGQGSTFWFELPFTIPSSEEIEAEAQMASGDEPAAVSIAGRSILLVEDNPTNQLVAGIELQNLGLRVTTANNGKEALEMLAAAHYDLVFMDCQMPIMDGYEATGEIRKSELASGKHITVIAMTANALQGDREKCLEAGMDDYITKPFEPSDLKNIITKWIAELPESASTPVIEPAPEPLLTAVRQDCIDLTQLRSRFTPAQADQLISVFTADTKGQLPKFDGLFANDDQPAIAKLAHSIKGAASMIFASPLAEAVKALELSSKSGAGTIEQLSKIKDEFADFEKAAQEFLAAKSTE